MSQPPRHGHGPESPDHLPGASAPAAGLPPAQPPGEDVPPPAAALPDQRFLQAVLDSLSCPFYVVNARTYHIRLANRALGHPLPPDATCHEVVHQSAVPCGELGYPCPVDEVRLTGKPAVMEHAHRDASGRVRYTEVHAHPMYGADGELSEVIEYAFDVTPRKEAERALHEERDFTAAVLDTTAALVVVLDAAGRIVRFNRACELLSGWSCDEVRGKAVWDILLDPDDRQPIQRVFAELRAGHFPNRHENHWITRGGGRRLIEWSNTALFDARGQVSFVVGTGLDVTERRQHEARIQSLNETLEKRVDERTAELERQTGQLRRLSLELTQTEHRERRRLAQTLHDDLQQLLVGARLGIASLHGQLNDPRLRSELAGVNQILEQAIETTRSLALELGPPVLQLAGLAAALRWLGRNMEQRYGLAVAVAVAEGADPQDEELAILLFQSVRELLFNVVKHARVRQAAVTMTAREDGQLQVVVADEGAGFQPDELGEDMTHAESLGLFGIRDRLRLLGGQLILDSAPHGGTRVTLIASRRVCER
jgi:PAS domain S-box-containing protein